MQFKDRLNSLLASKNLTYTDLAKVVGVTRQGVQSWSSGRTVPTGKNLYKLAQYFGVPAEWLKTGEHSTGDAVCSAIAPGPEPGTPLNDEEYVCIPEYSLRFAAGPDADASAWEQVEDAPMAIYKRSFFRENRTNPKRCRRAAVSGDSMEPVLWDHDIVLFEEVPEGSLRIRDGAVYALSYGGDLRVRRLCLKANGDIVMSSDNPRYEDEIIRAEDRNRIKIFGRVFEKSGAGGL